MRETYLTIEGGTLHTALAVAVASETPPCISSVQAAVFLAEHDVLIARADASAREVERLREALQFIHQVATAYPNGAIAHSAIPTIASDALSAALAAGSGARKETS